MPGESSSFCVVPWLHRLVDERGFLKVCCVAEGHENFLTDDRGERLHVQGAAREEEILNNPKLKELRRKMLGGDWDPLCTRCLSAESAGGTSSRTGRNHHFRHRIPELLAGTAPDGTVADPKVRHVDLRLGNYCNLTCRMCSPGASKLWIDPYNRVQPERYRLDNDRLLALRHIEWVDDPDVWVRFRDLLPSIEWVHFAGGEPMMIPEMIHVLRLCVESGFASAIDLSYNTNITLLPESVADLWPRFKSVSLSCSVDGYGPLNEYIRRPSQWHDVDRHLRTLDRHFLDWNLRQVYLTTTVQVYNVLDLHKLYAYLRSSFEHVLPAPLLNPLSWPPYLSVQTLPPSVKALACERLQQARAEYLPNAGIDWILTSIDTIVDHMNGADLSDHWQDFLAFTTNSDREFHDSFETAAPELSRLVAGSDGR
jgi:hypothetical protein